MCRQEVTYKVMLVTYASDSFGYTNYVFENLEPETPDDQYLMCVRFPNWEQETFDIGDIGYVTVRFVREGVDKWFDGKDFNTYRYTNVIFLKFIKEKQKVKLDNILID